MRVLFDEHTITPFPHGRPGDKYTVRFEPTANFAAGGQVYQRGWGIDVPGLVMQVSGGPGITLQGLRLRPFELVTTTDSTNPRMAAWTATILDAAGEAVERWRAVGRLRLAPDVGRPDRVGGVEVRRCTVAEACEASERLRTAGLTPVQEAVRITVTADAAGAAPRPAADPTQPQPVVDTGAGS